MTPTDWIHALPLTTAASWLITWAIHSTLLLAAAWGVSRLLRGKRLGLEETVWRLALVGSLVTATLQVGTAFEPLTVNWRLTPAATVGQEVAGPANAVAGLPGATLIGGAAAESGALAMAPKPLNTRAVIPTEAPTKPLASTPGVASPTAVEAARPFRWAAPLLALWLCGALLACLPLALAGLRLSHYLRRRQPVRLGPAAETLNRLLRRPEVPRRTRLSATPRLAVPIALGFVRPEICLPERAGELDRPQQASLVAHETAHLVRHDPLWLLATRLLEGIFFFQPLVRIARRRLEEIAEFRCDDWARQQTGQPSALARCLTSVAAWSVGESAAIPVPGMVGHRSGLARRIERLLDRNARPDQPSRWLLAAGITAVLLAVLGLPAVTLTATATADDETSDQSPVYEVAAQEPRPADEDSDANGGWVVEGEDSDDWMAEQAEREADFDQHDEDEHGEWEYSEGNEHWNVDEWDAERDEGDWEHLEGLDELVALEALQNLQLDILDNLEGLEELAFEFESFDFEGLEELALNLEGMDLENLEEEFGDLDLFDASGYEALTDWSEDFAEEWEEFSYELSGELEGLVRLGEHTDWSGPESEELNARIAAMVAESMPDREVIERLADQSRRLAEQSRPDSAEIERLVAEAQRLAERERPSEEEIEQLRRQAMEIAEQHRPSEAELERLRVEARRIAEQHRPSQEELQQLRDRARALAEQHRPNQEELERLRNRARALAEQHRPSQEELERLRAEARVMAEEHRHEMERQHESHRYEVERRHEERRHGERRHEEHRHEVERNAREHQRELERRVESAQARDRDRSRAEQQREIAAQRRELEQRRRELERQEQVLRDAEERLQDRDDG